MTRSRRLGARPSQPRVRESRREVGLTETHRRPNHSRDMPATPPAPTRNGLGQSPAQEKPYARQGTYRRSHNTTIIFSRKEVSPTFLNLPNPTAQRQHHHPPTFDCPLVSVSRFVLPGKYSLPVALLNCTTEKTPHFSFPPSLKLLAPRIEENHLLTLTFSNRHRNHGYLSRLAPQALRLRCQALLLPFVPPYINRKPVSLSFALPPGRD